MIAPHVRHSALGGFVASRYYNRRRAALRRFCASLWQLLGA